MHKARGGIIAALAILLLAIGCGSWDRDRVLALEEVEGVYFPLGGGLLGLGAAETRRNWQKIRSADSVRAECAFNYTDFGPFSRVRVVLDGVDHLEILVPGKDVC